MNFRQKGCSIVDYTRKGDKFNVKCPEKFWDVLGHQLITRLDDKRKFDLVQIYLEAQKSTVSYMNTRQAVEKSYQRFGKPSLFDGLRSQSSSSLPTPIQSKLIALFQALRIPPLAPLSDNPLHYFNYYNANMWD